MSKNNKLSNLGFTKGQTSINDIALALKKAESDMGRLQKESYDFYKKMKNIRTPSKQQRQQLRSFKGTIESLNKRIKNLRSLLKSEKKKEKAPTVVKRTIKPQQPKSILDNLNKAERKEIYKNTLYIPQFLQRLEEHYGPDWTPQMSADVLRVLRKISINDINEILNFLDITKMYYESDQIYSDTGVSLEADYVYKTIMSYDD